MRETAKLAVRRAEERVGAVLRFVRGGGKVACGHWRCLRARTAREARAWDDRLSSIENRPWRVHGRAWTALQRRSLARAGHRLHQPLAEHFPRPGAPGVGRTHVIVGVRPHVE